MLVTRQKVLSHYCLINRALKEARADLALLVKYLKQREPLVDEALERKCLGMVSQVVGAYGLSNPPTRERLFNAKFLPPQGDRMPVQP